MIILDYPGVQLLNLTLPIIVASTQLTGFHRDPADRAMINLSSVIPIGVKLMTQSSSQRTVRRGRVFPEKRLSPEEKARIKAEDAVFYKRCREVFDRVQPELIQDHYDWFIIIEPDTGEYFIDPDKKVALSKSRSKHPGKKCIIMQINETGTCGTI